MDIDNDKYFLQSERLGFKIWTLDLIEQAKEIWCDSEVTKLMGASYNENDISIYPSI
jgi:hypothetical protein